MKDSNLRPPDLCRIALPAKANPPFGDSPFIEESPIFCQANCEKIFQIEFATEISHLR